VFFDTTPVKKDLCDFVVRCFRIWLWLWHQSILFPSEPQE
jgi:hypothetical protein